MPSNANGRENIDKLQAFCGFVDNVQSRLPSLLRRAACPRLNEGWSGWSKRLDRLRGDAKEPAHVTVALLGTMGSGKSTLINTLLGAEVLATKDAGEACTAVPCELRWEAGPKFHVEIVYLSPEEWEAERTRLLDALDSTRGETDAESLDIREEARKSLQAIFGLPESIKAESIDPTSLPRLEEDLAKLRANSRFAHDGLAGLGERIRPFLTTEAPRWPLIRSVRVGGPFPRLPSDVTLVDLPGTNDPNQARESVTRRYLHRATNVWVVFTAKRSLGRDVMRPDMLLSLLLASGTERLGFVATHADGFEFEKVLEALDLPADGPLDPALRRKAVEIREDTRKVIAEALVAQGTVQEVGIEHFFLTSARDFDRLSRPIRKRGGPVLESHEQTGIPALLAHLDELGREYGLGKQLQDLRERLAQLLHEAKQEAELERVRISQQLELSENQRKSVDQAVLRALASLKADLNQSHRAFADELEKSRQQLMDQLRTGLRRGRGELEHTELKWKSLAWNTLKAICRGGGSYCSKVTGRHDFPAQLIQPVFETVMGAWDAFFGKEFTDRLTHHNRTMQERVREFGSAIMEVVRQHSPESSSLPEALAQFQSTTEKALAEALHQALGQAATLARETRTDLVEKIQVLIKASMAKAFRTAAAEHAPNVKNRILAHLFPAAQDCTQRAYDEVQQTAESATSSLHQHVIRRYQELLDAILHQAGRSQEQLTQAVAAGMQEELLVARKRLDAVIQEFVDLAKNSGIDLA